MDTIKGWRKHRVAILASVLLLLCLGAAAAALELTSEWNRWTTPAPRGVSGPAGPPPGPPPAIHLTLPPLSPGEEAEVPVLLQNVPAPGLASFDLEISFATDVIRVQKVLPGDPPWTDNSMVVSHRRGLVALSNTKAAARSGDLLLAILKVEAVGQDHQGGALQLEIAKFRGPDGIEIPVSLVKGHIPRASPTPGPPADNTGGGGPAANGGDPGSADTEPAFSTVDWLAVAGNQVVNQRGEGVVFRGVNIENREWVWDSEQSINFDIRAVTEATAAPPAGWGANIIVLAVGSGPINRNDATYLDHLDELVEAARSNGAYTLLVYRYPEPNSDQPAMPDAAAEAAMASLAARYAAEPSVLYGLQAEPHDVTWSQLKPRFISMIDAIRVQNPRALIVVPGTQWGRYVHWALTDPIPRGGLIYKVHYYDSFDIADSLYRLSEVAARYPLLLGEFGTGSRMEMSDVKQLLDLAEARGISWAAWLFHDRACPCLLSNAEDFSATPFGAEVRRRLQINPTWRPLSLTLPGPGPAVSPEVPSRPGMRRWDGASASFRPRSEPRSGQALSQHIGRTRAMNHRLARH